MNITINELKILLSLNGNQRLPHLEEEIFFSRELTVIYLERLLQEHDAEINLKSNKNNTYSDYTITDVSRAIYVYSRNKIKGRWLIAERHLLPDTYWYKSYRRFFGLVNS